MDEKDGGDPRLLVRFQPHFSEATGPLVRMLIGPTGRESFLDLTPPEARDLGIECISSATGAEALEAAWELLKAMKPVMAPPGASPARQERGWPREVRLGLVQTFGQILGQIHDPESAYQEEEEEDGE